MAMTDQLLKMLKQQRENLTTLEEEVLLISQNDLVKENTLLQEELSKVKAEYQAVQQAFKELRGEASALKNALYEQIYNERIKILQISANKLDAYFKASYEGEQNRLTQFENGVKQRIHEMSITLRNNRIDSQDEIYQRLDELAVLLEQKVTLARAGFAKTTGAFSENEMQELSALKEEQITEEAIKQVAKKNNIESFVGLNLINKFGIFFIIIGVITLSQLTYMHIDDRLKGIMMFTLGGMMLLAGELMNRKKANIFSLGITSGGVAVLYVALSVSYFGLHILKMYPAIALCVLITAGAFVLSKRYNSQTIAAFALIGGYLPILSLTGNFSMIYGAMVYFVALNLLALMISFHKKWMITTYIGFILNTAGTIYLTIHMLFFLNDMQFGIHHILTILYILFAFVIYTLIPILATYMKKLRFQWPDIVMMGANTFVSSLVLYGVFYSFDLEAYTGLLAAAFALIYLGTGWMIDKNLGNEKHVKALFYITGLAFVVLIIPFQFGKTWLSLGWLAQGVLLTSYGILTNEKSFKKYGFIIGGLCLLSFLFYDLGHSYLFEYKYFALTLGSLIILSAYVYKRALYGRFVTIYKIASIINLWLYMMYLIYHPIDNMVNKAIYQAGFDPFYLITALAIVVTFTIAYLAPRINILSDTGVKVISICLYGLGILWLFGLNLSDHIVYPMRAVPTSVYLIGTLILVIIGLLSVFALHDLVKFFVMEKRLGIEWYPLLISFYFVLILTQNLITQYQLEFINVSISIIYVLAALSWIVFGFVKRYALMRRFGLGLSFLAIAKLFMLDLANLTKGYQIVSYFAFGLALIAISLVYQSFNKRLELKGAVMTDAEEGM